MNTPRNGPFRVVMDRLARTIAAFDAQIEHVRRTTPEAYYDCLFEAVPASDYWVATGRGRTRHIADKTSASLASTGTPSYFVHAVDALAHFPLLGPKDRVLLVHRRGEPGDLLNRLLKAIPDGVPVDVISDHPEGWPNRPGVRMTVLAPEPAAPEIERDLVMLALGDSLVCGLESARKFTEVDFLRDHPKGSLGKNIAAAQAGGRGTTVTYLSPPQQALAALVAERDGIAELWNRLDEAAVTAWLGIYRRPWRRVITTGMGKPGYCMRYVAMLANELGRPAFYLHPAEGVHGDLGRIGPDSLVIAYSHSGETEEVANILPRMKERRATLLVVTNKPASTLGKAGDAVLQAGGQEVDPIRKAPTGSTTVALSLVTALVCADMAV